MEKILNFQDIFKKNFIETQKFEGVTFDQILIALLFAFFAGMFIYLIYRAANHTAMFVNSFGVTLVAITMITTLVIVTITSNVLLSLGMVGALSIVRFRTAVKEAIDIAYMFWAISIGIAVGAGFYFIATVGSLLIGAVLFILSKLTSSDNTYVLVIATGGKVSQTNIEALLKNQVKRYSFKAKSNHASSTEFTYEIRLGKSKAEITDVLSAVPGVDSVSLVGFKTQNYL